MDILHRKKYQYQNLNVNLPGPLNRCFFRYKSFRIRHSTRPRFRSSCGSYDTLLQLLV